MLKKRGFLLFATHLKRPSPRVLKAFIPAILITLLLLVSFSLTGCSSNKILRNYSEIFVTTLNKETDACTNLTADWQKADIDTENGILSFQKILPNHLQVFNDFLVSY